MKSKLLMLVIAVMAMTNYTNAQVIFEKLLNDELYHARVKLVDEFFDRFNLKEYHPNLDTTLESFKTDNIIVLFDYESFKQDKNLFPMAVDFAKKVVNSKININYSDTSWTAIAKCRGKLRGKSVDFTLFLNVEKRSEDMFKWVITRAEGEIFDLKPEFTDPRLMILPNAHETNFMQLSRITQEKDNVILNYKDKNINTDPTSVFFSLVHYGLLDISGIIDLQFEFRQVPSYVFTIKNIDREHLNAGWLIYKLVKK